MQLEPIIKVKIKNFAEKYFYDGLSEDAIVERFVNWTIIQRHQPNAFTSDNELLDAICVGGQNDMAIDGLCVFVNGIAVKSPTEAKDIVNSCTGQISVSFIFIQSKNRAKLNQSEHDQFLIGIKDFIGEKQYQPYNDKIKNWLDIKNYLMSEDCCLKWSTNPSLYIYYSYMGDLENTPHTIAGQNRFIDEIKSMNTFQMPPFVEIVNSDKLKRYCDEIENKLDIQLSILESCSFLGENEHINGVSENSFVAVCRATEILKLISSEDGLLRRGIFDDNVRDFQGETLINNEILDTIQNNPKDFVLYNNGITIVCNDLIINGKNIKIHNPQIVNGCQTCNIIFRAAQEGYSNQLSEVKLIVKVISTTDNQIINNVVKGTNRQNIVQDEAFETIRKFHKELEEFFISSNETRSLPLSLYYERRSKQYDNRAIKEISKVRFSPLIRGFISIFLSSPHRCVNHPALLQKEYSGKIFVDHQSYLPYYTSAQLIALFDDLYQKNKLPISVTSYKFHLAFIFALVSAGFLPDINNTKKADTYCEKLLAILKDPDKTQKNVKEAVSLLEKAIDQWINVKGSGYRYGIKDNADFTNLLIRLYSEQTRNKTTEISDSTRFRGTIKLVRFSYGKLLYGFISKPNDNDVYFNSSSWTNGIPADCVGTDVLYDLQILSDGRQKAYNIQIIK